MRTKRKLVIGLTTVIIPLGICVNERVAFEVPEDAKTIEIEFEDNFWTESKIVFLYE